MQKLTLNVDELRVEAFETAREPQAHGTVKGYEDITANPDICNTWGSCGHICP